MLPSPATASTASSPTEPIAEPVPARAAPQARVTAGLLVRQALLGLFIATVLVLLLLFAGAEDRGFIYIDF